MAENVKRLNVVLEPELHTAIKVLAAQKDMTITQFAIEALKEKLQKEQCEDKK